MIDYIWLNLYNHLIYISVTWILYHTQHHSWVYIQWSQVYITDDHNSITLFSIYLTWGLSQFYPFFDFLIYTVSSNCPSKLGFLSSKLSVTHSDALISVRFIVCLFGDKCTDCTWKAPTVLSCMLVWWQLGNLLCHFWFILNLNSFLIPNIISQ